MDATREILGVSAHGDEEGVPTTPCAAENSAVGWRVREMLGLSDPDFASANQYTKEEVDAYWGTLMGRVRPATCTP